PSEREPSGDPLFYLVQARPLGGRPEHRIIRLPSPPEERTLLTCHRALGNGKRKKIHHLIFVDPSTYRWEEAHAIARQVGQIDQELDGETYILMGPGRWGTSNPQLGVPVQYGEIAGACVIVEMATESFSPELSYGTHFYADMVASRVLYLPFDAEQGDHFNRALIERQEILSASEFITHVRFEKGLAVYVDGKGKKSLICIQKR
ncbi:pyruvate, phosphate dikinase, partial [Candidatus Bipolaricaulota bacterium]|nr:pyruvate, phosphate dikinase [Candidatus Bipolaricaulota bacterium]